jgi:DNA modification methylase
MLIHASATHVPLADESVQCIVTSPPYWGLRKYAGEQELVWHSPNGTSGQWLTCQDVGHVWEEFETCSQSGGGSEKQCSVRGSHFEPGRCGRCGRCGAWRGAYGLEPTVEMYVEHSIQILRELRRVLRKDGVLFWNIGDCYHNGDKGGYRKGRLGLRSEIQKSNMAGDIPGAPNRNPQLGLKNKDLVLMPFRVALAAQADGWWVRSIIVWAKPNPMPESVTDRPTDAYEHILMLTKSARYFWDADAVREKATEESLEKLARDKPAGGKNAEFYMAGKENAGNSCGLSPGGTRNLRNVWEFPTQPYAGAHFATFPEELPRRCILAATSAKGACIQCGAPWQRILEERIPPKELRTEHHGPDDGLVMGFGSTGSRYGTGQKMQDWLDDNPARTIGWSPTCRCRGQHGRTQPCVVLDPFGGSGTTGRVAIELGRQPVLLDIAYAEGGPYGALARERLSEVQTVMPF